MGHHTTPYESLPPREHSRLTKKKTNTYPTSGLPALLRWPYRASAFLPAFSRLSRKLHDPKTTAHSCTRDAFPNVQTKRPKPEPYARILGAYPKPQTSALPEAI